jgi:hypothetical protein
MKNPFFADIYAIETQRWCIVKHHESGKCEMRKEVSWTAWGMAMFAAMMIRSAKAPY